MVGFENCGFVTVFGRTVNVGALFDVIILLYNFQNDDFIGFQSIILKMIVVTKVSTVS